MAKWGEIKCTNCAALEERLEAAQRDAKEAEAYAAELEAKLAKAVITLQLIEELTNTHDQRAIAVETLLALTGDKE